MRDAAGRKRGGTCGPAVGRSTALNGWMDGWMYVWHWLDDRGGFDWLGGQSARIQQGECAVASGRFGLARSWSGSGGCRGVDLRRRGRQRTCVSARWQDTLWVGSCSDRDEAHRREVFRRSLRGVFRFGPGKLRQWKRRYQEAGGFADSLVSARADCLGDYGQCGLLRFCLITRHWVAWSVPESFRRRSRPLSRRIRSCFSMSS
ncbi:uncharacterized protein J3D65DRAFT_258876 [Phyllosticta citribraziliensis]|uniref:Uncharacterized protein n=1 Tax=Phyllosticta citribraziliensis TaxID=989973 RepID=A0ABR1M076_9PEZI